MYEPGWELQGLESWRTVFVCIPETGIHYCGSLEMIIYSICVRVCVCELERQRAGSGEGKIGSGRRWTMSCLEGSPASSDSWIPSLTMSTTENVLLEGHIEDLTGITCNRTTQNIPIRHHIHESFSTHVAMNKTLRVPQITAWGVKPRTTVGSLRTIQQCQCQTLAFHKN